MAKVLVFCDYYLPGFRAGGPIVSISREIAKAVNHEIFVTTRNHDLGNTDIFFPFADVYEWKAMGNALVDYSGDSSFRSLKTRIRKLRSVKPDIYYFNSVFSFFSTLLPLVFIRLRVLPRGRIVIAPRGETSYGALRQKSFKKVIFAPIIRCLIPNQTLWHVSTTIEKEEHGRWLGANRNRTATYVVRINSAQVPGDFACTTRIASSNNTVFVSRIDRKKGLDRAIKIVSDIEDSRVVLKVYGAISDTEYFFECLSEAQTLIEQGRFEYFGEYRPDEVSTIFEQADLLIFPTDGENFGHVVAEALSMGCPVLAPPTTPWSKILQNGGGDTYLRLEEASAKALKILEDAEGGKERAKIAYSNWFHETQPQGSVFDNLLASSKNGDES